MSILVFMSDNRPVTTDFSNAEYNSLAAVINYIYCKKHGYEFVYHQSYFKTVEPLQLNTCVDINGASRHASWAKLLSALELAKGVYDYIVYLDSDCIFKDHACTIENYINNSTKDIFFVTNFMNGNPHGIPLPGAGFFIFKVNDISRDFIRKWYEFDIKERNENLFWEQDALWLLMYNLPSDTNMLNEIYQCKVPNRPLNSHIEVIDDITFIEKEGQFLLHICHVVAQHRKPYFSNYIIKNNFNYTESATGLLENCFKQFDTSLLYNKPPKILILMTDSRDLNSITYNSLAACINYEYSKRRGYDFLYKQTKDPKSRNKIAILLKLLDKNCYDYIVHIDSDTVFINWEFLLETYISEFAEKDIIFTNNEPRNPELPWHGFFICKNSTLAKEFLTRWLAGTSSKIEDELLLLWFNLPYDVNLLKRLKRNFLSDFTPLPYLGLKKGYPVRRVSHEILGNVIISQSDDNILCSICKFFNKWRSTVFSKIVESSGIVFEKNISDIKLKSYYKRDST